jgi:hypothetical protein
MKETEHYHLKKPEDTDFVMVSDLNGNADAIDAKLHELATEVTPIARGGTGATDADAARANLGLDDVVSTRSTQGPAYGPLLSVTAEGHAEQDGTPTPSDPKEIRVVRGRNLLQTIEQGAIGNDGDVASTNRCRTPNNQRIRVEQGKSYVFSGTTNMSSNLSWIAMWYENETTNTRISTSSWTNTGTSLIAPNGANYLRILLSLSNDSNFTPQNVSGPQLELGPTAHPYVPYGHVGLDVTADGTTTTTPIPLPSRGWVGSLPDGTHDALSIDGAGKVTWELADAVVRVSDLSFSYDSTNQNFKADMSALGVRGLGITVRLVPMLSDSFVVKWHGEAYDASWDGVAYILHGNIVLHAHAYDNVTDLENALANASFYYPLATPTTVDVGYVDLPDIPEGAVVSMPELEGLGVESWTSDAVARYVRAWAARS